MTVASTSRESISEFSGRDRKHQIDVIFDVVAAACRNGAQDISLQEIAYTYELVHGKRIDVGTVSGRVNALVTAKRLVRLPCSERRCTRSNKMVHPVTVAAQQARMFS
jgi:hypothetical protein